jgi:hypothetical protein
MCSTTEWQSQSLVFIKIEYIFSVVTMVTCGRLTTFSGFIRHELFCCFRSSSGILWHTSFSHILWTIQYCLITNSHMHFKELFTNLVNFSPKELICCFIYYVEHLRSWTHIWLFLLWNKFKIQNRDFIYIWYIYISYIYWSLNSGSTPWATLPALFVWAGFEAWSSWFLPPE